MRFIDLTGKTFGRLTAQWVAGRGTQGTGTGVRKHPPIHWLCSCECGALVIVTMANLSSGNSTSCGCYYNEMRKTCNLKHGKSRTPEHIMYTMAKVRAKKRGWPFDIELSDIVIPSHCPMLAIPLIGATGKLNDNSPTLDRIICDKGYVKGNIRVISYKANRSKSNLTLEEMKLMVANWI